MTNNIGLILDPSSFENLKYVSQKAEKNGFHSLWVTELYRSSFEQLSYLSSITSTINLGSAVTLAFTRSPLVTVISAHDIDEISNGRLILGLGSGAINTNRKWHNSPLFDKPTERMGSFYQLFRKIEESLLNRSDLIYKDEFYDLSIEELLVEGNFVLSTLSSGFPDMNFRCQFHTASYRSCSKKQRRSV